jgi:hypothetical protein
LALQHNQEQLHTLKYQIRPVLKEQDVKFTMEPTEVMPRVTIAVFEDTCGNLIQIMQK